MKSISIIKFIAGLFILILINTMLYNNNTNWDLTKEKRHSISEETINILENLEDKIYIKIYLEGELPSEFVRLQKHCIQLIKNLIVIVLSKLNTNL